MIDERALENLAGLFDEARLAHLGVHAYYTAGGSLFQLRDANGTVIASFHHERDALLFAELCAALTRGNATAEKPRARK